MVLVIAIHILRKSKSPEEQEEQEEIQRGG
jgi:hypothetical protein